MKTTIRAIALSLGAAFALPALASTAVPCEQMLKQVRDTMKTAQVSAADMDKAKAAEQKGIDRCKADDDAGADTHFAEALKLLGKP